MFWLSNNILLYRDTSEAIYRYVYILYRCNSSLHIWPLISLLRDNVLAIKRKGMESKQYSLSVWFMACIANHNTTWLLGDTTFLQPNGSSHECTRPTPIQLATLLASNQCCKRGWTGSRVNVIHCVMVKNINHVSSMVAVEKLTDKYMKSTYSYFTMVWISWRKTMPL